MREITTHKVNGLNEAIRITVLDEPGPGGAHHWYELAWTFTEGAQEVSEINFQNGPIAEAGVNGISNEALLAIVQDRLECFQKGAYACQENADALTAVCMAMDALASRTRARITRGVEGTMQL